MKFHDNDTVSYSIVRTYKFDREKSSGDIHTDTVVSTNVVLLAASTKAVQTSSLAALAISTLAKSLNSQPIINITVNDYLFGFEDPILSVGSHIVPSITPFEKFGFFDQFIRAEENHVVTTTLKEFYEEEELTQPSPIKTEHQESAIDVEYEDVIIDETAEVVDSKSYHETEKTVNNMSTFKPSKKLKLRDYAIELWNGSPFIPSWEQHGMSNKNK